MGAAISDPSLSDLLDWSQLRRRAGESYLLKVEQLVSDKRGELFVLESRSGPGFNLRIVGIDDTIYRKSTEKVDGWGKFYLPQEVKMCVFAVVEDPSGPYDQLVLMTCENKKVYGYDGEELHEVASDLTELCVRGLEYPASKRYYHSHAPQEVKETLKPSFHSLLDLLKWDQLSSAQGEWYLFKMEKFVSYEEGKCFALKSRSGSGVNLRIAGINDTIYRENTEEVNSWEKFYLPQVVKLCVFAVVEGTSCLCDQLVLMTCENKKVYGYDGEDLHEVASDLKELCVEGLEYPASKSYYYGEAFKDMTDDDWAEVRKGDVGQSLDEEHQKLVEEVKDKFMKLLS